jgi:hypothetical protein
MAQHLNPGKKGRLNVSQIDHLADILAEVSARFSI